MYVCVSVYVCLCKKKKGGRILWLENVQVSFMHAFEYPLDIYHCKWARSAPPLWGIVWG